jgi:hypothetical protein
MPNDSRSEPDPRAEFEALQVVIAALQDLDDEARRRIIAAASTFLSVRGASPGIGATQAGSPPRSTEQNFGPSYPAFSDDRSMSPKEFLLLKQPRTDVERIAVLAYYLTHYRDTPEFKTLDLSKLNTESAQPKFSNAANAASNAVKTRYLVATTRGQRQLSAAGERFVEALPDRDAARAAMAAVHPRRKQKRRARTPSPAGVQT